MNLKREHICDYCIKKIKRNEPRIKKKYKYFHIICLYNNYKEDMKEYLDFVEGNKEDKNLKKTIYYFKKNIIATKNKLKRLTQKYSHILCAEEI